MWKNWFHEKLAIISPSVCKIPICSNGSTTRISIRICSTRSWWQVQKSFLYMPTNNNITIMLFDFTKFKKKRKKNIMRSIRKRKCLSKLCNTLLTTIRLQGFLFYFIFWPVSKFCAKRKRQLSLNFHKQHEIWNFLILLLLRRIFFFCQR